MCSEKRGRATIWWKYLVGKENINLCVPFVEKYDELISCSKKMIDIVSLERTTDPFQKWKILI